MEKNRTAEDDSPALSMSNPSPDSADRPLIIATSGKVGSFGKVAAKIFQPPSLDSAAASLVVNDNGAFFSGEGTLEKIEVISSGFPNELVGFPSVQTMVRRLGGEPTKNQISMKESRWGAVINQAGSGWIAADAYLVRDGRFKNVVFIPLAPPSIDKDYRISADAGGDSATALISLRGATIRGEIRVKARARARGYGLRVTGKVKSFSGAVDIFECRDSERFTLVSQPSQPVILVAYRKFIGPWILYAFLRQAGVLSGAMVGGFGKGLFKAEMFLRMPLFQEMVFSSEIANV
jgi:hypothetical protein